MEEGDRKKNGAAPSFGNLMAFIRVNFQGDLRRNGSVLKALIRKWGLRETEAMIRGAFLLGWKNLVILNAKEGVGRRWATAAYWQYMNHRERSTPSLASLLHRGGL